jgi:hypothetical protein
VTAPEPAPAPPDATSADTAPAAPEELGRNTGELVMAILLGALGV